MGMRLEAVKSITPKHHPPAKTLRLCEEILDECWKADQQTATGGARALRNARRAAAGEGLGMPFVSFLCEEMTGVVQDKDRNLIKIELSSGPISRAVHVGAWVQRLSA